MYDKGTNDRQWLIGSLRRRVRVSCSGLLSYTAAHSIHGLCQPALAERAYLCFFVLPLVHGRFLYPPTAPDLSGSGQVDMLTRPVALARAAVATRAPG